MPAKKKAPKRDDAFVDYPTVEDLVTGPDPDEDEDLYLAPLVEPTMPGVWWFLYLAIAIFCAGLAVNVCQMGIDWAVTTYQSDKFMRWQEDQIRQYQNEHPGSHPHTKDFDSDANL